MPAGRGIILPKGWLRRLERSDNQDDRIAGAAFRAAFEALISSRGDGIGQGDRIYNIVNGTELIRADRIVLRNSADALIDALIVENDVVKIGTRIYIGEDAWIDKGPPPYILFKADGYMNVFGRSFGADSDLSRYYGPYRSDVSSCTKLNAALAETNAGVIYRNGVIDGAEPLTSFQESTALTAPTFSIQTEHGPGDTALGNDIKVTASYEAFGSLSGYGAPIGGEPSAQVKLYETIGGGSETLIDTYDIDADVGVVGRNETFSGGIGAEGVPFGSYSGEDIIQATVEVTRSNSASTARIYRWELTARSMLGTSSQRLSVQTEEQP
jgi:hypothetical protein